MASANDWLHLHALERHARSHVPAPILPIGGGMSGQNPDIERQYMTDLKASIQGRIDQNNAALRGRRARFLREGLTV